MICAELYERTTVETVNPPNPETRRTGDPVDIAPHSGEDPPSRNGTVRLWIRLVGDFEAHTHDGASVLPISKKARGLLALVAAHMPQPLRRDFAASLLWSNKPKDHAANSLRQALRELQLTLAACGQPPIMQTGGGRLSLPSDAVWIDIHDPNAIRWKPDADSAVGPLLLCQNLQGLDPAFDAHLERLWKNLVFQQAFVTPNADTRFDLARPPESDEDEEELALDSEIRPPVRTEEAPLSQGWRIAVLPFRSLGTPLEGGLSLGMAEEISAALARFRMPRLIATGSFWDGSGPVPDALARCREYNLDYVISGTIQASGQRIRVTVTLLDVGMDFEVIWASRFEGTTADLFTLQDTIASQTVAQIDPELLLRHQFRGEAVRTANAAAHQSVLTAIQGIYRPDRARFLQARDLLVHAIELDSEYAAAHAWLAYWNIMGIGQGWIDDATAAATSAGIAAERAVVLDPMDARGVTVAGHTKAYLLHDVEAALALHHRATTLNPNLPIAWTLSSWANIYNGDHKTALEHAKIAEDLSPSDPHVFFVEHAAMTAQFFLGDYEAAEALAASVLERKPGHASALKVRVAILARLGRTEEAAACVEALRSIDPMLSVDRIVARPPLRQRDLDNYSQALREAGIPG
jgi:TolB-like protein